MRGKEEYGKIMRAQVLVEGFFFKNYTKCHHVYKIFHKMDSVLVSSWKISTISYQATTHKVGLSSESQLFSYSPNRI